MPIPTTIDDLSTTPGDNFPDGTDTPDVIDNVLREHAAYIAQLRDNQDSTIRTDLATTGAGKGAEMVANQNGGTVQDFIDANPTAAISVLRYITPSKWAAILAGTSADDLSTEIESAAAAKCIYFPVGTYLFNADIATSLTVIAHGATIKPYASGKVFNFTGSTTKAKVIGGTIDMTGFVSSGGGGWSNGDIGIHGNGIASLECLGVEIIAGGYPIQAYLCADFVADKCRTNGAQFWGITAIGCSNVTLTNNRTLNCVQYDGLKVGGNEDDTGPTKLPINNVIIAGNISTGNTGDGLDIACNGGNEIIVHGNVFTGNALRGIDVKILELAAGADPLNRVQITSNSVSSTAASAVGINVQDNLAGNYIRQLVIADNPIECTGSLATGIRIENMAAPAVRGNEIKGSYWGVRVRGCTTPYIEENKVSGATRAIGLEDSVAVTAGTTGAKIRRNRLQTTSACVWINVGDLNEVDGNEFDCTNSAYAIQDSGTGLGGTNTQIGMNRRGWSATLPTGNRARPGEYWENPSKVAGSPDRWVCVANTSSTTATNCNGFGQIGFRTNAGDPTGTVTPLFVGEELYSSSGSIGWFKSTGTSSSAWQKVSN